MHTLPPTPDALSLLDNSRYYAKYIHTAIGIKVIQVLALPLLCARRPPRKSILKQNVKQGERTLLKYSLRIIFLVPVVGLEHVHLQASGVHWTE